MTEITLSLPYPPTANNLFFNTRGRGRVRTDRYRTWAVAAGGDVRRQNPGRIEGQYSLDITLGRPDKRKRDLSNAIKALEDLIVEHQIVEDDSLCAALSIQWGNVKGCVLVLSEHKGNGGAS
jgi:Holliday junction resolvase RusA-like endonuclease